MRKFYLYNQNNEKLDLNQKEVCFAMSPSNFGITHGNTYVCIGSVFVKTGETRKQDSPEFTMVFSGYDKYQEFVDFAESADSLKLGYMPEDTEYFRNVCLYSIDKSEIDQKTGLLQCKVQFAALTDYYVVNKYDISKHDSTTGWVWPITWPIRWAENNNGSIEVVNNGHEDAFLSVVINGYISSPVLRLYQNSVLISEMDIPVTAEKNEYITYSSAEGSECLTLTQADGTVIDKIQSLDYSKDNFFKIPKGTSTITITSDTAFSEAELTVTTMKRGV